MKTRVKELLRVAVLCFIQIILALISFRLKSALVPFSLSLVAVFICGALLDPRDALLSQMLYITLGIAGLPIFARFGRGVGAIAGIGGGFIISYPFAALFISLIKNKLKLKKPWNASFCAMAMSLVIVYLIGGIWMVHMYGFEIGDYLVLSVLPFVFFDLIKAAAASSLLPLLKKIKIMNIEE
ncbi:MAG: biotin transporter BioY [Clostridia bacterium]|nr:biotin transporter BioY [Clostridia bacterium]